MKKNILLLMPILFLGLSLQNPLFFNNKVNIDQNSKIIDFDSGLNNNGISVDTDDDENADILYMWGDNNNGQIGNGLSGSDVLSPLMITPDGQSDWGGNIIDISLGNNHSGVIIDTDLDGLGDTLYMWGDNDHGQIGNGLVGSDILSPTIITPDGQSDWDGSLINLSLGVDHSGITVDTDLDGNADTLYMWGDNYWGQLGNGTSRDTITTPTVITPDGQSDWNGNIIDLSLGSDQSGISIDIDQDNYADTLYMWGNNDHGQIGNGGVGSNVLFPIIINPSGQSNWGGNIIDLSFSIDRSGVTIDTDQDNYADTLYMWGNTDNIGNIIFPAIINPEGEDDWSGNIIDFDLGSYHNGIIIDTDQDQYGDTLYMWGSNSDGQLGDGTLTTNYIPSIITPEEQSDWNENLINLSLGGSHSGVAVDANSDGYADTLYMWGNNYNGQFGNGLAGEAYGEKYPVVTISSYYDFFLENLNFYNNDGSIEVNIVLNDYQNIIDEAPEVILSDGDSDYTTTFIDGKSDILNDQYYYQLDNTLSGKNYNFTEISINDSTFNIDQNIITDYIISDYTFASSTEETITINLDLAQNSDDFNILDYSEDQRKIEINYVSIANNISNSQQFILDQTNQITLTNLNAETNYRIDSINYFYVDDDYKYTIEQEVKVFQTSAATPLINADSISLIENSLTGISFEYTIEIDNLKENDSRDNFTQYDINNGIWLIDQEGQTYNSSFISEELISDGQISGTQNYQLTFLQEDLTAGQTYNFVGIGFNDPNGSDPDTVNFSSPFVITTIIKDKKFVDGSFAIDKDSITKNSFQYSIAIDDLILTDNTGSEPVFSNFDPSEGLYLKDQDDTIYPSSYINNTASNLGAGEEEGTVKYQFSFKVNNLSENTTYNFTELSFTNSFEESIDISEKGEVETISDDTEKAIIWISIVILIIILLFIAILLFIELRMKKRTREISEKLNDSDF